MEPHEIKINEIQKEVYDLISIFPAHEIVNDDQMEMAGEALSQIKAYLNRTEESRKALVKPLNDHVSYINKKFKESTQELVTMQGSIATMMGTYRAHQEAERSRLAKEALVEAEKVFADSPIPELVAPIPDKQIKKIETSSGSVSFMDVWKWELINIKEVPRQYFMLDETLIGKLVKAGERNISGIRIYSIQSPVVRK